MKKKNKFQNNDQIENSKEILDLVFKNWGSYCSSCGSKKSIDDLKLLKVQGPILQIMSECNSCGLKTMISTINTQYGIGMQISQMRSDTKASEMAKFKSKLTRQDLLDFYNELNKINNSKDLLKSIT